MFLECAEQLIQGNPLDEDDVSGHVLDRPVAGRYRVWLKRKFEGKNG